MRASIRAVVDLAPGDLEAWRDLAARAFQPNPMFEPECLVPAARHLVGSDDVFVVVAEEDGSWMGCVPVRRAASWRAVRRPVLTTAVRRMIYDGTPLVDARRSAEALACLLGGLQGAARTGEPGVAVLEWVDDGPVALDLGRAARSAGAVLRVYESWERPMVLRRDSVGLTGAHSAKFLRNLRRLRRRLATAEGGVVQLTDRSATKSAVDVLLSLESSGYKGAAGVAVGAVPGEREWFVAMCDGFREQGRLHLSTLDVGGRVVAAQLLVRGDGGFFSLKTAYDERVGPYSPGIQLHLDVMEHIRQATDAQWIDTCTYPGNETLLRLYPDRRSVASMVVATGGVTDRSVLRAVTAARRALGRNRRAAGRTTGMVANHAAPAGRSAMAAVATAVR
jgi:CelD/BcsL family acetyltransferase involved in cellulose biosynthesis